MTENTQVVVIGGGYAGVMAANRLTQRDDVTVTLINPRPNFVERMRLHQLVAGTGDAVVDLRGMLADRIRLIVDSATRIDASKQLVTLSAGGSVGYDFLIYAVGSDSAGTNVPGAGEFAYSMVTLEAAERLRPIVASASTMTPVTVVGAGVTGIETAAELAEQGRAVTLVCGEVLGPYLHPRGRSLVAKQLAKLGVTVVEGAGATVTAVTRDAVRLADGRDLPSTITIWTAGFGVPDLAARSGLSTDAAGRLLADETLTSVDDIRIVAAGDSAAPSDLPFRMSAWAAQTLGAHAADTVLARIAGEDPTPVELGFFGLCVGLGRRSAAIQGADSGDTANRIALKGRVIALLIKEFSTKWVTKHLADEGRKPGSHRVLIKDRTRQQVLQARRENERTVVVR